MINTIMALKNIPLNLIPRGTDRELWRIVDNSILPPGGGRGHVLVKLSSNDYDVQWIDPNELDVDFGTYANPLEGPYTGFGDPNDTDLGEMADIGFDIDFGTYQKPLHRPDNNSVVTSQQVTTSSMASITSTVDSAEVNLDGFSMAIAEVFGVDSTDPRISVLLDVLSSLAQANRARS